MAKMHKHRLLFAKEGRAIYISHLDLMRTFPRAFLRAGLNAKATEGYHQHTFVSIAIPLTLGFSSRCEILEFELLDDIPLNTVPGRLNAVLPEGIVVLQCYEAEKPVKQIAYLDWECRLTYDSGIPDGAAEHLLDPFGADSYVIQKPSKKSKKGYVELDLVPLIHEAHVSVEDEHMLIVYATLAAQNPGLNPEILIDAAVQANPLYRADFSEYTRCEIKTADFEIFR